ncbi:MAG: hypothetical protein ABI207_05945 [Crocinitomicaceae bacterium]
MGTSAQTKKDGTPDMRYKANKETYNSTYSPPARQTIRSNSQSETRTIRPVYSGQTHTVSHGGSYPGSVNSHHKNGHYLSPTNNHVYGIHKTKKYKYY